MELRAHSICKRYIDELRMTEGEIRSVIGVSGGADSICLLFLMKELVGADKIRVLHINHMIRGSEADEDSEFVRKTCKELGIYFKEIKEDVPALAKDAGLSEEEAGRRLRYGSFEKECVLWEEKDGLSEGSVRIAVAHHMEDNAETVLFNLFRGSGIKGLSGMPAERGRIIRPLLDASRKDIEEYLESNGISYVTDKTNSDNSISRNRIRNVIIPEAEKISPSSAAHIASAADKLRKISGFLEESVRDAYFKTVTKESEEKMIIDKKGFAQIPEVIGEMLLADVLTQLSPGKKDIGEAHILAVFELMTGPSGRHADLPYGIKADVSDKDLLLRRITEKENEEETDITAVYTGIKREDLTEADLNDICGTSGDKNKFNKYFDCDKITIIASSQDIPEEIPYEIRKRRAGDYLVIKDSKGDPCRKSVGDYLTDLKLRADEKEKIRVFAVGSEVLWVIGYRMGDSAKISDDTKEILKLEVREDHG